MNKNVEAVKHKKYPQLNNHINATILALGLKKQAYAIFLRHRQNIAQMKKK